MTVTSYKIKITNDNHGAILQESFVNPAQFKLFLKMIQGCLAMKEDLTFFNGVDFLIHVPYRVLVDSIIKTDLEFGTLTEQFMNKSKIEAPKI